MGFESMNQKLSSLPDASSNAAKNASAVHFSVNDSEVHASCMSLRINALIGTVLIAIVIWGTARGLSECTRIRKYRSHLLACFHHVEIWDLPYSHNCIPLNWQHIIQVGFALLCFRKTPNVLTTFQHEFFGGLRFGKLNIRCVFCEYMVAVFFSRLIFMTRTTLSFMIPISTSISLLISLPLYNAASHKIRYPKLIQRTAYHRVTTCRFPWLKCVFYW